jgi:hypothetical protein
VEKRVATKKLMIVFGDDSSLLVGRCTLTPYRPRVDRVWFQRLRLEQVQPPSNVDDSFDLRPYILFRPNVTNTTLGDAIRKGFLNEVSDNGRRFLLSTSQLDLCIFCQ